MSPRRVIGIDTGGTKLLGGVVDEALAVRDRVHRLWRGGDRRAVLDLMVDAVGEARAAAPEAGAVGIGVPGLIDSATGAVGFSTHLPIEGLRFRDVMEERLGLPVFVDNDTNLAALAEQRAGAARGASHVAMLTLGTGIGGGLVLGGRLYRGAHGAAAELGHVVVDMDGPPCQGNCPNHGCLEAMASGTAIGREGAAAAEREPDSALGRELRAGREITGALVTELAHDGDAVARGVLALAGERLGVGITSIVNALNPEVVVVGGGAMASGELLLEPARRVVAERALPPSRDQVRIERAHFGDEAGMVGAAILAFEEGRV
ncbi:MAG: glucokinase [Thermoleophilaceae bacterium]|jgi:glucokinase|nr:glucokinase [Thermoleophilaceae bacterium]MEA2351262.1 glucokinase [Thermoleophilaceae bacterium]MEA2353200.1 glucokinase [Thermoleophilaceae bacterium]MEA2369268.1 glucokinase [Thermoleophilaceae bacterium]MEA2388410.1 glucokinase [Thermoleophilaceae bacterium]